MAKTSALRLRIVEQYGTQEKFAAITGMREDRLSKLVRGIKTPTDKEKIKISKALKSDAVEIFGGKE